MRRLLADRLVIATGAIVVSGVIDVSSHRGGATGTFASGGGAGGSGNGTSAAGGMPGPLINVTTIRGGCPGHSF